jgi:hypothetical protein
LLRKLLIKPPNKSAQQNQCNKPLKESLLNKPLNKQTAD